MTMIVKHRNRSLKILMFVCMSLLSAGLVRAQSDVFNLIGGQMGAGSTADFPIYFEDVSGSGIDTGTENFGGFFIEMTVPAGLVASAEINRAGVLASASVIVENKDFQNNRIIWGLVLGAPPLLTLDPPSPGDRIATLTLEAAQGTAGQTITFTPDPTETFVQSELGGIINSIANGGLVGNFQSINLTGGGEPTISSFEANPTTIQPGGTSTLSWDVSNADTVEIDQGIGQVAASGSTGVSPTQTTTYTLTATNINGSATRQVTVNVQQSAPVIVSFEVTPTSIQTGESAELSWEVQNADTIEIDQGIGAVSATGTQSVSPTSTTTYTLTASNAGGTQTAQATLTVTQPGVPNIVSFTVTPTSIEVGESAELAWEVEDADSVSINQGIGGVSATGTQTVSPEVTTTYTLTATGTGGTETAQVTLEVTQPGLPNIVTFTVTPSTIQEGETALLEWEVQDADLVQINQGIGPVQAVGSQQVSPVAGTTIFRLTASNTQGSVQEEAVLVVTGAGAPDIIVFSANPQQISEGGSSLLTWEVENADTVTINPGVGSVNLSGVHTVTPSETTTYVLTATNSAGTATDDVTIIVGEGQLPEIISFTATPTSILRGESSTLAWEVDNADTVTIDHDIGEVDADGSVQVSPEFSTVYRLTATNIVGAIQADVNVNVSTVKIISFQANPEAVLQGQSTTLSWQMQGATSATINPGEMEADPVSGSMRVTPMSTTTYTLTGRSNSGETNSADLTVRVYVEDIFEVDPLSVDFGESMDSSSVNFSADSNTKEPFEISQYPNWLEVNPASGEVDRVAIRIALYPDRNDLFPGQVTEDLVVFSSSEDILPLELPVRLAKATSPANGAFLYFPEVINDKDWETVVTLANTRGVTGQIDVQLFNASGVLEKELNNAFLGAFGTFRYRVPEMNTDTGWVAVSVAYSSEEANNPPFALAGCAVVRSRDGEQLYALSGIAERPGTLFVPHIAKDPSFYTRSSVVNVGPSLQELEFFSVSLRPMSLGLVDSAQQVGFDYRQLMGGEIQGLGWGELECDAGAELSGVEVFGRTPASGLRQAVGVGLSGQASQTLHFAHIAADVVNFWTGIVVINVENQAGTVTFEPFDGDGRLIDGGFTEEYDPFAKKTYLITGDQLSLGPDAAWLRVTSNRNLVGYELFGTYDDRFAGFESISSLSLSLVFPHVEDGVTVGGWTGIAVFNPNPDTAELQLTLRSRNGTLKDSVTSSVAPNSKLVALVADLFNAEFEAGDSVHLESTQYVAGFALFGFDRKTLAGILAHVPDPVFE